MEREAAPTVRPPVVLGCVAAVAAVAAVVVFGTFVLVFLNSGADDGKVALQEPAAYGLGTLQYISDHNFYLARLQDGSFLALSDLDAANRANQLQRCRVAPLGATDPALGPLVQQYATKFSPGAAGTTVLFRESCNLAVYDLTGQRLDAEGPNLDRYATATNSQGLLTVDLTKRTCTQREGAQIFAAVACR